MGTNRRNGARRNGLAALPGHLVGASAWTEAATGILLVPASARRLATGVRRSRSADVVRAGCGIALGLFGWTVVLLAAQGLVNGLLYPLVDAHDYQHSWGGPTLAGAWLVHAAGALALAVATLLVLRGVAAVDRANEQSLSGGRRRWWPVPLSVLLGIGVVVLVAAWFRQV
ncbi:hypothetical protein [Streptomyces sp. NPDC004267]|uniref:hypothetical protein n=1 Tax=Streptomyces sp. NPDC004267 TaxID=3364694 RepID=UPI00369B3982